MTLQMPCSSAIRRGARQRAPGLAVVMLALFTSVSVVVARPRSAVAADQSSPSENREQLARRLYAEGEADFKAGQYDAALKAFEGGYAASPRPGFVLNMAHTERKLGDLRKARSLYKKYLLVDPTSRLRDEVRAVIAELDSALADEDLAERRATEATGAHESPPDSDAPARTAPPIALPSAPPPAPPTTGPVLIATRPPSSPVDSADQESPFYRRAWFWVVVGVVVAAGAGGAIYATQRSGADPFHPSGSLGALGP